MKLDKENDTLLILGIFHRGVIVADIIASKLPHNCNFDIIIPRKLAAPNNQEIAIGAIMMEDGILFLNDDLINELEIDKEYIEKEKTRQLEEIKRRKSLYSKSKKKDDILNKLFILVDDGAATGATLISAARWLRKQNPSRLIIAIPVTSKNIFEILKQECDIGLTGTTPSSTNFKTVSQYYQEFKPVEDEQVIEVCRRRRKMVS